MWVEALDPSLLKKEASLPRYPNLTTTLRKGLYPVVKEGRDFASLLARLAHDCQKVLHRYRDEEERLSPDDLLLKMSQALNDKTFLDHVRSLFHAAIIDEFQDTDPLQWQIFRTLFLDGTSGWPGHLYLVGDPKQSIYAFRQADIYTYLAAGQALGTGNTATLGTNSRSQPLLVRALNTLFSNDATPGWIPLPRLGIDLKYHPVLPSPLLPPRHFDDGKGAIHFFLSAHGAKVDDCEKCRLFPFIAGEIDRLHQAHALPYSHFAVLVRDRYQGARLAAFFKERNIPFVNQRSSSLADSPAIPAMIALIQAVIHPRNLSAVRTALGSCLIGWDEQQVLHFESEEAILLQFHALRQQLLQGGFAPFFQSFLASRWHHDSKNVWEHLLSRGGESTCTTTCSRSLTP